MKWDRGGEERGGERRRGEQGREGWRRGGERRGGEEERMEERRPPILVLFLGFLFGLSVLRRLAEEMNHPQAMKRRQNLF